MPHQSEGPRKPEDPQGGKGGQRQGKKHKFSRPWGERRAGFEYGMEE